MPVSIPYIPITTGKDGIIPVACEIDVGYGTPQIPDGGYIDSGYGAGWDATSNFNYDHGGRWEFVDGLDCTQHRYLNFNLYTRLYRYPAYIRSHADSGMLFLITDSMGNYRGWNIYGSDLEGYENGNNAGVSNTEGWFNSFQDSFDFLIDPSSDADFESGVVDLSDIVAIEIHVRPVEGANRGWELYVQKLRLLDDPILQGSSNNSLDDLVTEFNTQGAYSTLYTFSKSPRLAAGNYFESYRPKLGLTIGDGIDGTVLSLSQVSLGVFNLHKDAATHISVGGYIQVSDPRVFRLNQSPTDIVDLTDFTLASSSALGFVCEGDVAGNLTVINSLIAGSELPQLGHGSYTDTQFVDCKSPVEVTADTALSGCAFRDGDYGIKLLAGPGDHSALETRFGGIAVHDIELGSGGAGAYDLSGVTLRAGDTLKIHNDSLNDISVILPAGMSYSTSSDGGAITVISPPTTYTLKMPNIQQYSRVQIYNTSSNTEILNELVGPAGVDHTMISGADYSPGDIGRVRVTYQSSAVAFEPVEIDFTFSEATTINALPTIQSAAASYNAFGVDGSTAPEFAWDSGSVEVDINDIDNETSVQRFAAWWHYFITTPVGIQEAFGAVAWESLNSVRIVSAIVDLHIDNLKNTPLRLTGGRMYRDDGQSIIAATSNSIHVDYAPVYTLETGVSGLTASESAKLDAIGSVPAAVWTHVDRQLTDDPFQGLPVDDLDTIVTSVWSAAARTLTASDNSGAELTAAERQAIIDGVWNAASRSLTTAAGVTGQNISDIVDAVWSAAARTLTASDNSGAELTAAERQAIIDGVWGAASRSLTTAAGVTEQNINDIAQRVWDHEL